MRVLVLLSRSPRHTRGSRDIAIDAFRCLITGRAIIFSTDKQTSRAAGDATAFGLDLYVSDGILRFIGNAARSSLSYNQIYESAALAEAAVYKALDHSMKEDTEAARFWTEIQKDALQIDQGLSALELSRFRLWDEVPNWFERERDKVGELYNHFRLEEDGFAVWFEWYDAVASGRPAFGLKSRSAAELLERKIALGGGGSTFHPEFWHREPGEINREIAEWVAEARAAERVVESPSTELGGEARPAGYVFVDDGKSIKGQFQTGLASDNDITLQTAMELVEKLKNSGARLGRAQVDPALPKAILAIAEHIERHLPSLNAGLVLSQYRAWEANFVKLFAAMHGQQFGDDLSPLLESTQETFEDLKAMFPAIAPIEANRLALKLQSTDAQTVDQSIVAISVVAETNVAIDLSARDALKDLQAEVSRLNEVIESSADQDAVALAIETRGVIVGQRAMTTAGFVHTVLKAAGSRIAKAAGDGLEKGVADVTEAGVKLALVSLAGYMVGPLGALAAIATMFGPLEKKARDIKVQSDVADV
jgi:hypothetical protein